MAEIDQKLKFRVFKVAKNGIFRSSRTSKIDFTQNLSDRKMLKFPHCAQILVSRKILAQEFFSNFPNRAYAYACCYLQDTTLVRDKRDRNILDIFFEAEKKLKNLLIGSVPDEDGQVS